MLENSLLNDRDREALFSGDNVMVNERFSSVLVMDVSGVGDGVEFTVGERDGSADAEVETLLASVGEREVVVVIVVVAVCSPRENDMDHENDTALVEDSEGE